MSQNDLSVTVCTIPKKWTGEQHTIQTNAVNSWKHLGHEIILLGDDAGTAEAATTLGCKHIPNLEKNKQGTPLISSAFKAIRRSAHTHYILYVNADIILDGAMASCIEACKHMDKFLLVGQRHNAEVTSIIDFDQPDWRKLLSVKSKPQGRRSRDYFLFERNMFQNIPDFAIGRGRWDSWMVGEAILRSIPVIDVTEIIRCIHQNHDFHIPGVRIARGSWRRKGVENQQNIDLIPQDHPCNRKLYTTGRLTVQDNKITLIGRATFDGRNAD